MDKVHFSTGKDDRAVGNCYDYNIADFGVEGDPEV